MARVTLLLPIRVCAYFIVNCVTQSGNDIVLLYRAVRLWFVRVMQCQELLIAGPTALAWLDDVRVDGVWKAMPPITGTTCRNCSSRGWARMNGRQSLVEMVGRWVFLFFGNAGPDSTAPGQQFGSEDPDGA